MHGDLKNAGDVRHHVRPWCCLASEPSADGLLTYFNASSFQLPPQFLPRHWLPDPQTCLVHVAGEVLRPLPANALVGIALVNEDNDAGRLGHKIILEDLGLQTQEKLGKSLWRPELHQWKYAHKMFLFVLVSATIHTGC